MATCKDCKLWDRESIKTKAGAILSSRAAQCLWVSTEAWPLSVSDYNKRPIPGKMTAKDGKGCDRFIKRDEK